MRLDSGGVPWSWGRSGKAMRMLETHSRSFVLILEEADLRDVVAKQ